MSVRDQGESEVDDRPRQGAETMRQCTTCFCKRRCYTKRALCDLLFLHARPAVTVVQDGQRAMVPGTMVAWFHKGVCQSHIQHPLYPTNLSLVKNHPLLNLHRFLQGTPEPIKVFLRAQEMVF